MRNRALGIGLILFGSIISVPTILFYIFVVVATIRIDGLNSLKIAFSREGNLITMLVLLSISIIGLALVWIGAKVLRRLS